MAGQTGYQPPAESGFSQGGFNDASKDSEQAGFQPTKNDGPGFTQTGFRDESQTERGFQPQTGFQASPFTPGGFQDPSKNQQKGFQPSGPQIISVDTSDVQTLKDTLAQVSTALEKADAILHKLEVTPVRNTDPGLNK